MEFTDKDKDIARALMGNADYRTLLKKVFIRPYDLPNAFAGMDNVQLGEHAKAHLTARTYNEGYYQQLTQLGQPKGKDTGPAAKK